MSVRTGLYLLTLTSFFFGVMGARTKRATCDSGETASNEACCTWYAIRDDIQNSLFSQQCGEEVHESLRLAFHDAIGYSPSNGGGGADGSILTFSDTELAYTANAGVQDIVDLQKPYLSTYNVSAGDFVQFAAALGTSYCPGAPKLSFYAGRPAASAAAPDGTVSQPFDSVDDILTRFSEVGFSSDEVVALLASHSIAAANIDTALSEAPLDSTPGVFDSQFFVETLLNGTLWPGNDDTQGEVMSPLAGELRLESDFNLARDSRTACTWQSFVDDQDSMRSAFAAAMLKLSVVQQNMGSLTDCSEVIPDPPTNSEAPYFPSTLSNADITQACTDAAFPTLTQNAAVTAAAAVLS